MFRPPTSISFKAFCLDQLEAAREQLEEEDPLRGRIAHILADSIAELIVHYQAEHIEGVKWSEGAPREAIERLQPEALEQDLRSSVSFTYLAADLVFAAFSSCCGDGRAVTENAPDGPS